MRSRTLPESLLGGIVLLAVVDAGVYGLEIAPVLSSSTVRASDAPSSIAASTSTTGAERLVVDEDASAPSSAAASLSAITARRADREHDLIPRERLRGPVRSGGRDRELRCPEDRHDAGQRERRLLVDAADPGMRLGRHDRPACSSPWT
jgi:hypothetical protein